MRWISRAGCMAAACIAVLLLLLLLGWALSPTAEVVVARGRSVQIADGFLTVRMWCGPHRAADGAPADEVDPGSVPDTRNIPMPILLALLAVPATALGWSGRRTARMRHLAP